MTTSHHERPRLPELEHISIAPRHVTHEEPTAPKVRVYIWDIVVRACHWGVFVSMVLLTVTGLYIGAPFVIVTGEAGQHFVMGWMKVVHFYAAILFTLSVCTRVVWMFAGHRWARWKELVPVERERRRGLIDTLLFYILIKKPPSVAGHNPLAGVTYLAVFSLYFVMILTGLGMYGLSADVESPLRMFAFLADVFGGPQTARWIHHIVMWLLLGFVVHHFMSALLVTASEKSGTMDSIFSGYKWLPQSDIDRENRRWTRKKKS